MKKFIFAIMSIFCISGVFASEIYTNKFIYKSEDKTLKTWFERIIKQENIENKFVMEIDEKIINKEIFKEMINEYKGENLVEFLKHVMDNLNNEGMSRCEYKVNDYDCKNRLFMMDIYINNVYVLKIVEKET